MRWPRVNNLECLWNYTCVRFSIRCPHAFALHRTPMKHPNLRNARGRWCHVQTQSSSAYPCSSALHPTLMKLSNSQNVQSKVPSAVEVPMLNWQGETHQRSHTIDSFCVVCLLLSIQHTDSFFSFSSCCTHPPLSEYHDLAQYSECVGAVWQNVW